MNKGIFPERISSNPKSGDSLNQLFSNLVSYCDSKDFNDVEWLKVQIEIIDKNLFRDAHKAIKFIGNKFGIKLSEKKPPKTN